MPRLAVVALLLAAGPLAAAPPEFAVREGRVTIARVSPDCPIVYDNDWWRDTPDAAYLWVQASRGKADLRGNVVSRDMWEWQKGYKFTLAEQMKDATALLKAARASGVTGVPDPVAGADRALVRPPSGKVADTKFTRTAGSDLIVREAKKASPAKPLLVFAGGPCTTVATAYLTDPTIAASVVVFQVDGGVYNAKDEWAWHVAETELPFVNWAEGYFWGDWSRWNPADFRKLPANPLGDALRAYADSGLGRGNQWGDLPWVAWLYDHRCLTDLKRGGKTASVPKAATNVPAISAEFFRAMTDPAAYGKSK